MSETSFGSAPEADTPVEAGSEQEAGTPNEVSSGEETAAFDVSKLDFGEDTQVKDWISKKGLKSVEDIARTAYGAEKLVGQKQVDFPGSDATPEELDAFYAKAGRPENAEGYSFNLPEGIPEDFPYDAESRDKFAGWAHEAGLRPEQASKLHDLFVREQAEQYSTAAATAKETEEASVAKTQEAVVNATKTLEKEFGAPSGSDKFNADMNFAQRFVAENGGDNLKAEMLETGALVQDGEGGLKVKSPMLVAALARAGRALYQEGGHHGGSGRVNSSDNPWSKEGWNLTKQIALQSANPTRAGQLKAIAGNPTSRPK